MAEFAIAALAGQGITRDNVQYLSAGFGNVYVPDRGNDPNCLAGMDAGG
jgi:hypothetical protein